MRVLLVAAATLLAGCAGSAEGPALPDGEFTGQANLICAHLATGADQVEQRLESAGTNVADARRIVAGFSVTVTRVRTDLADLRPPAARQAALDAYLATLDDARSRLEAASVDNGATQRLLRTGGVAGLLGGLDQREADLGLTGCTSTVDAGFDDEGAMTALTDALAAERIVLAGGDAFSESPDDLALVAPDLAFEVGLEPAASSRVYVKVGGGGRQVYLGARTGAGSCFYVLAGGDASTGYATDAGCGPADDQDYQASW